MHHSAVLSRKVNKKPKTDKDVIFTICKGCKKSGIKNLRLHLFKTKQTLKCEDFYTKEELIAMSKQREKDYNRSYYEENKDQIKDNGKGHSQENKEKNSRFNKD